VFVDEGACTDSVTYETQELQKIDAAWELAKKFEGHTDEVTSLAFDKEGHLFSGSYDCRLEFLYWCAHRFSIRVWKLSAKVNVKEAAG
jgi:WD40 repeat protein